MDPQRNVLTVTTAQNGDTMPPLHLVINGALTVNASAFTHEGTLIVHPFRAFRAQIACPDCAATLIVRGEGPLAGASEDIPYDQCSVEFVRHGDDHDDSGTLLKEETEMDMCTFAFPTSDDAAQAACNLHDMASGVQAWDAACAAHCAWTLQGYALSQGCPCPCPGPCPDPTPEQKARLRAAAEPAVQHRAGTRTAPNWLALIQQILAVLVNIFGVSPTPAPAA